MSCAALDDDDIDRWPEIFASPDEVLYDTERPGDLIYVFTPSNDVARKGKVVVRINYTARIAIDGAPRRNVTTNSVRSAGYVRPGDLPESRCVPMV